MVARVDVADSMSELVAAKKKQSFDFYSETRSRSVNAQSHASPPGVLMASSWASLIALVTFGSTHDITVGASPLAPSSRLNGMSGLSSTPMSTLS